MAVLAPQVLLALTDIFADAGLKLKGYATVTFKKLPAMVIPELGAVNEAPVGAIHVYELANDTGAIL